MDDIVIAVQDLGKRYRIGAREKGNRTFREALTDVAAVPFRRLQRFGKATARGEIIWALRDVFLEVKRGEVLGIIGRNGAGKTTLLKILSRITQPTEGRAEIRGRVGSLLEVGTGFHPELTGRENIYLNGAVLGMKKKEITQKFDEIVDFAGVERFIDTPVKRYSSGMHVRLAFAVAAHLEPEILLVDEVLAVGDASFQKKCLGKMGEVAAAGRTVLFVSHNMSAVVRLCQRACLLESGHMVMDDKPGLAVKRYLGGQSYSPAERIWDNPATAPGDEDVRLHAVRIRDSRGRIAEIIDIGEQFTIELAYWCLRDGTRLIPYLDFIDEEGRVIFVSGNASDNQWSNKPHPVGLYRAICHVPGNLLNEGRISINAGVSTVNPNVRHVYDREVVSFVVRDQVGPGSSRGDYGGKIPGAVRPLLSWEMECEHGGQTLACSAGHEDSHAGGGKR